MVLVEPLANPLLARADANPASKRSGARSFGAATSAYVADIDQVADEEAVVLTAGDDDVMHWHPDSTGTFTGQIIPAYHERWANQDSAQTADMNWEECTA